MANTVRKIEINEEERKKLEGILRQSTVEARVYLRAKILLQKADGKSNEAIAEKLDISIPMVRLCIEKYCAGGVEAALQDRAGRGRRPEITGEDVTWVISKACQKPKDCGYSAEFWYPASFTRYIQSIAEKEGHPRLATVSETTLRKILKKAKIRPFHVSYYCEKRDPDFDAKMHDVLVIYKQLSIQFDEEGNLLPYSEDEPIVHTLSYDEKPGIQAIGTTAEDKPPIPYGEKNSTFQRDYEYVRFGTLSLLAGIDLLTGVAIPLVSDTHKSSDFVRFLTLLDEEYPKGDKIRLILDNHSAHISKETQTFLNGIPGRFEFVFTPTHGSWLNLVEGFFSKMTKQMLNGIRVGDKAELEQRIYQYFDEINQVPIPYRWSYNLDNIDLEKEDISQIVYEVVNQKAALASEQVKRAPAPRKRSSKHNAI